MTYHLQSLALKSLYDYTHYITDVYVGLILSQITLVVLISALYSQNENRGFEIILMQKGNLLVFDPPFKNFKDKLTKVLDDIVVAVMTIPRVESQLYLDFQGAVTFLKVDILK